MQASGSGQRTSCTMTGTSSSLRFSLPLFLCSTSTSSSSASEEFRLVRPVINRAKFGRDSVPEPSLRPRSGCELEVLRALVYVSVCALECCRKTDLDFRRCNDVGRLWYCVLEPATTVVGELERWSVQGSLRYPSSSLSSIPASSGLRQNGSQESEPS